MGAIAQCILGLLVFFYGSAAVRKKVTLDFDDVGATHAPLDEEGDELITDMAEDDQFWDVDEYDDDEDDFGAIVKAELVQKHALRGIYERWEQFWLVLRSDGSSPTLVITPVIDFTESAEINHHREVLHICSQFRTAELRSPDTMVLSMTHRNEDIVLKFRVQQDASDWVALLNKACSSELDRVSVLEQRLADSETRYDELLNKKADAEQKVIALQAQLEECNAKMQLGTDKLSQPLPPAGPKGHGKGPPRNGPPPPLAAGSRGSPPPMPTGAGRGRPPAVPAGVRPPPQNSGPRKQAPAATAKTARPGELLLNAQREFIQSTRVTMLKADDLHDWPVRELLDVEYVKPKETPNSQALSTAESTKGTTTMKGPKKDYALGENKLQMRSVSMQALLRTIDSSMGSEVNKEAFLAAIVSKDNATVKAALNTFQTPEIVDIWYQLLGEVQDDDVEAAAADDVLMGRTPLPPEFGKIDPPSQFVAFLVGKWPRLRSIFGCLATFFETRAALEKVHVTTADKHVFFISGFGAAGNLVTALDNAISNFMPAVFEGMPPELSKEQTSDYNKIERAFKSSSTAFPGVSGTRVLPLLFVANFLNNERQEQRIRASLMTPEPDGSWSPYLIDTFLAFAEKNPKEGSYLKEIEEACSQLDYFKELSLTASAGVQAYQIDKEVTPKVRNCKPILPSIVAELDTTINGAEIVTGKLNEIIDFALGASGSISERLGTSREDLLQQVSKIAEKRLATETPPETAKNNDLLDDASLRNVLLRFCKRVSQRQEKIGSFHVTGDDL